MKKIVIMATISYSINVLIKKQPKYLTQYFDSVELIGADSGDIDTIIKREGVEFFPLNMERKITPLKDLKSLFTLILHLYKNRPDVVYTFTPKGGLLGMIAAFFARVPTRIHNVVGMPLMEAKGKRKTILKWTEKATYFFATHIYCNSFGLKEYINRNLTKKEVNVVGYGSINGVDAEFYKDTFTKEQKNNTRQAIGFKEADFVISYMGRVVKDKGIDELIEAFKMLNKQYNDVKLLIVGKFEDDLNPISIQNKKLIESHDDIRFIDFQNDLREYLSISDLFVLPSYREGLPNALLEAGSFGIPLVATDINGCNEIIIDEVNGKLVEKKSIESLYLGMKKLYKNNSLYDSIKTSVRDSIVSRYDQKFFLEELKKNIFQDAKETK